MPVPSEITLEGSFTFSLDESITRTTRSSYTYSASALETEIESSSTLTVDTLSMISTPWVTESLDVRTLEPTDATDISSAYISWADSAATLLSSTTLVPLTSTTYGIPSPPVNTDEDTTITILCGGGSVSTSKSLRPLQQTNFRLPSDTFSSWTLESYTSSGWFTDSKVVRAKYPWSPSTVLSGTEIYPSTLETFTSRKGSRVTIGTAGTQSSRADRPERGHLTPAHYLGLASGPTAPAPCTPGKLDDIPMGDALNAILAV